MADAPRRRLSEARGRSQGSQVQLGRVPNPTPSRQSGGIKHPQTGAFCIREDLPGA